MEAILQDLMSQNKGILVCQKQSHTTSHKIIKHRNVAAVTEERAESFQLLALTQLGKSTRNNPYTNGTSYTHTKA